MTAPAAPAAPENLPRLRSEILALAGYKQGTPAPEGAFKLSSNENPFDPLPGVLEAMASASEINRYPGAGTVPLRERLAERYGVGADEVHIGAGSVAIISQLFAISCARGDEAVFSWRSFEAYPLLATIAGATSVAVPNTADHRHDLAALAAAVTERTRILFVCSPNNPTGTTVGHDEFVALLEAVPASVLVVLDEAYTEFCTDLGSVDGSRLLGRYPNLIVLRTFSKAWGLAGLRLGYALGPAAIMELLRTVSIPLSVTETAQAAGLASLDAEPALMGRVALLAERRDRMHAALLEQGWPVPASQGNFLWLPTGAATPEVARLLAEGGIVARPFAEDGVRVTVGEEESVDRLLTVSSEIVKNPPKGMPPARLR